MFIVATTQRLLFNATNEPNKINQKKQTQQTTIRNCIYGAIKMHLKNKNNDSRIAYNMLCHRFFFSCLFYYNIAVYISIIVVFLFVFGLHIEKVHLKVHKIEIKKLFPQLREENNK